MPTRILCFAVFATMLLTLRPPAARGVPVVFDNTDGTFRWSAPSVLGNYHQLIITLGPGDQPVRNAPFRTVPSLTAYIPQAGHSGYSSYLGSSDGLQIARAAPGPGTMPVALSAADRVGPGLHFEVGALWETVQRGFPITNVKRFAGGFIGVSFPLSDGTHYGFVEFEDTKVNSNPTPLRWGYDSEPGIPFHLSAAVPEPAAAWAAACVAALLLRHPRKSAACAPADRLLESLPQE